MGLFDSSTESAKVLLMGDQGQGKTGAKAALIAAGYKLRMFDSDNGSKILRSLLTDPHYPYAAYMKKHNIDPREPGRISVIPLDIPMGLITVGRSTSKILGPVSVAAWRTVINTLLEGWKDNGTDLGKVTDWDNDTILDFDTMSTLAEIGKYWIQSLNNRLGALEDEHGRDTFAAQEMVSRITQEITSSRVKCNVIVTTHITRISMDQGAPQTPQEILHRNPNAQPNSRGFPTIIGRALSPVFGKRWNDMLVVRREGERANAERKIYTKPVGGTDAKNSVWLEPDYPLSTGLAEIFAALQFKELPEDFVPSIRETSSGSTPASSVGPRW